MMETAIRSRGIIVFGGGTATNSLVDVFEILRRSHNCTLKYVIPISDNGGSSSELIRVFGGPGIGDVRSRLVRLIPKAETDLERASIGALFNYRLSSNPGEARTEWLDIVEGRHALWRDISSEKRELIRSIFNHMNLEIVRRARPSSVFNFAKASIGNLFLTGARLFTGSFESAIYLLSTICTIPSTVTTLPSINSNFTHHICAELADGSRITGQNAISHPSAPTSLPDTVFSSTTSDETEAHDRIEDATLPGSLPSLRKPYIEFTKPSPHSSSTQTPTPTSTSTSTSSPPSPSPSPPHPTTDDLPARISRIYYINPYGHEIFPLANPKLTDSLESAKAIIYSIGSLYTSLVPNLVLRGVGRAITASAARHKILILNSSIDRETGPADQPLTATEFVRAIVRAAATDGGGEAEVNRYVTHLLYLEGEGVPKVDKAELAGLGVECMRVYGRRVEGMLCYDEAGLAGALEAVIGKPELARSRRNTSGQ
ncbi:UPF0052-domain-containing protein [Poronia punctata]|nr:UPF0052-domain-containing protein [Poronia punctata]